MGELTNDSVVGEAELTLSLSLSLSLYCSVLFRKNWGDSRENDLST